MSRTLILLVASLLVAAPCAGQGRVVVQGPTAILLVTTPLVGSRSSINPPSEQPRERASVPLRRVAEAEGFTFYVRSVAETFIVDAAGAIYYPASRDAGEGVVLVMPGRQVQFIPNRPSPAELRQAISDYRAGRLKPLKQPSAPHRAA